MKPRISLITLGVGDLARSRRFYEQLGFVARPESTDEVAFFALPGTWLALWPRTELARDVGASTAGAGSFPGFALAHNVATQPEVDAVLAEAVSAGGRLVKRGIVAEWGGYNGYFADPDGFLWEVAW